MVYKPLKGLCHEVGFKYMDKNKVLGINKNKELLLIFEFSKCSSDENQVCGKFGALVLCPSFSLLCSFPYSLCFALKRSFHHTAICEIISCNFMAPPSTSPKAYTKRVVVQHRPFNNIPCRYVLKRRILCFKTVSSLLLL
jgi:hypothetical protein